MSKSEIKLKIDSRLRLNDGNEIPIFGLGVYQTTPGPECKKAVMSALTLDIGI